MSVTASTAPEVESREGEYAGFITRMFALVIDILIINVTIAVVAGVVTLIFGFFESVGNFLPGPAGGGFEKFGAWATGIAAIVTLFAMNWLYPTLFWMINGQTFGKRIMGLRVVRMNGEDMSFWRGLLRVLGYWLAALPLFLGFIWVLFSNKRRGWHDMLAGTCVIYSWEARGSARMQSKLHSAGGKIKDQKDES